MAFPYRPLNEHNPAPDGGDVTTQDKSKREASFTSVPKKTLSFPYQLEKLCRSRISLERCASNRHSNCYTTNHWLRDLDPLQRSKWWTNGPVFGFHMREAHPSPGKGD